MKDKILKLNDRLEELNKELSNPEIHNDQKRFKELSREQNELSKIMEIGEPYLKVLNDYEGNKATNRFGRTHGDSLFQFLRGPCKATHQDRGGLCIARVME